MQEAYRVGVSIALSGDVGQIIGKLIHDFERLDQAVNSSKEGLSGLTGALKGMAREGKSAADAWDKVAKSIQAAAKAARDAGAAAASMQPRGGSQRNAASQAQDVIDSARNAARSRQGSPGGRDLVPAPYQPSRGRYGDSGSGPTIALPYSSSSRSLVPSYPSGTEALEGEIIPPGPRAYSGGPPAGPYGPTINGTYWYPHAGGPTWGGGAGGGGGGGAGGVPAASPGGGALVPTMPPLNAPWLSHTYVPGKPLGSLDDFNGMAMLPDIAGFAWMKENWQRGAEFEAEQSHLAAQGFSAAQVAQAGDEALQVSRDVGAISPLASLHLINKLMNVTQDRDVALNKDLLEQYAKASVVLSSYGHGGELHELDAAVRAGEFRGVLTHTGKDGRQEIDVAGLTEFLNRILAMASVSGGDIGPSKVLQFLRSAGAAGTITTPEELTRAMALQIALGSSKAGSSLQGFEQQFTAGRMSEAAANLLIQMGIIQGGGDARHNPHLAKMGIGQFMMKPGAMPAGLQEEAAKNPSLFIMQELLPKFQQMLTQVYGDRYTKGDEKTRLMYESAIASQVASRIPGGVEMTEVIRNILLMQRDVAATEAALKRDQYAIQMGQNPEMQARSLGASYQGLQTVLGVSTIQVAAKGLGDLTGALNDLAKWCEAHAGATKVGMEMLAGALVALGAVGIVALASSFGGLTGALMALGAATAAGTHFFTWLDQELHRLFSWVHSPLTAAIDAVTGGKSENSDQILKDIHKNGVVVPWWFPLPTPAGGRREPFPFSFGASAAAAPTAGNMGNSGPKGTHDDPVVVHVQNQPSPSDIARGVSGWQATKANKPPTGYTGTDNRVDPFGTFAGMINAPY